jgi:hypothetical protein
MNIQSADLLGRVFKVKNKSTGLRFWWITVIEQQGNFVKVAGGKAAGKPWWVMVSDLMPARRHKVTACNQRTERRCL